MAILGKGVLPKTGDVVTAPDSLHARLSPHLQGFRSSLTAAYRQDLFCVGEVRVSVANVKEEQHAAFALSEVVSWFRSCRRFQPTDKF